MGYEAKQDCANVFYLICSRMRYAKDKNVHTKNIATAPIRRKEI